MSNPILNETANKVNILEQALFISKRFPILPLKGKTPYTELLPKDAMKSPTWQPLRERPATEPEIKHWATYPDFDYGIITGVWIPNGGYLCVFDLDEPNLLPRVELPETVTVKTARGYHFYFFNDGEIETKRFSYGDLKARGGYVVGPGSRHGNGSYYEYWANYSFATTEIAALPLWLLEASRAMSPPPGVKPSKTSSIQDPKNQIRHSKDKTYFTMPNDFDQYRLKNEDPEIAFRIMKACGANVHKMNTVFNCPLHPDKSPSAALYKQPGKAILFVDFHLYEGRLSWPLVDAYAAHMTGKPPGLKKGERVYWWLRALHHIGEITELPPVGRYPLSIKATKDASLLYNGFVYLMQLRQLYQETLKSPFNREFAAKWCLTDINTVRRGMGYLLNRNYIYVAERGRPFGHPEGVAYTLYSLGSPKEKYVK